MNLLRLSDFVLSTSFRERKDMDNRLRREIIKLKSKTYFFLKLNSVQKVVLDFTYTDCILFLYIVYIFDCKFWLWDKLSSNSSTTLLWTILKLLTLLVKYRIVMLVLTSSRLY